MVMKSKLYLTKGGAILGIKKILEVLILALQGFSITIIVWGVFYSYN